MSKELEELRDVVVRFCEDVNTENSKRQPYYGEKTVVWKSAFEKILFRSKKPTVEKLDSIACTNSMATAAAHLLEKLLEEASDENNAYTLAREWAGEYREGK